jgi:Kef-type K+ transport system membrane component KefB
MTLIAALSLLLIGAHLLGRIAERFGQPALLGQMLAGIALGPSLLGWVHAAPSLAAVADIAVLFVVVSAGLEMRMQHVLDTFRGRGTFALLLGFLIPAATAGAFAYAMNLELVPALVVTLCVSVTALPVALRILGGFGMLNTNIARVAISGALLSDVIVLLALGVAMAMSTGQQLNANGLFATLAIAIAKLGVLLAVVGACHFACLKLTASSVVGRNAASQPSVDSVLVLTVVFMFALGAVSELLGFHFAIGVFLAALMITRDLISDVRFESLSRTCELMTVSLFGPIFLAYQGIQFEIGSLSNAVLVAGLIGVAIVSKFVGGYAAARLQQMTSRDSWGVAIIMNARGVMEMVVASIAYRAGLVDQELFSALLLMGLVTTVITPWMLKRWLGSASATASAPP